MNYFVKHINDVIANINKSSIKEKLKPDTFKVFLKKLSEHQNTESALAALCKRSIALNSEQEKFAGDKTLFGWSTNYANDTNPKTIYKQLKGPFYPVCNFKLRNIIN